MTRDDLVKQLKKAEQRQAATRDHHISISWSATEAVFRAGDALHIWDTAYAAGAKDERETLLAAIKKLRDESQTIVGASDDYKQGREMGIQLCINELTRGEE